MIALKQSGGCVIDIAGLRMKIRSHRKRPYKFGYLARYSDDYPHTRQNQFSGTFVSRSARKAWFNEMLLI